MPTRFESSARRRHGGVYLGCFNVPKTIVKAAIEEDVDVVGVSVHSWEYLDYMDELLGLLRAEEADFPWCWVVPWSRPGTASGC